MSLRMSALAMALTHTHGFQWKNSVGSDDHFLNNLLNLLIFFRVSHNNVFILYKVLVI